MKSANRKALKLIGCNYGIKPRLFESKKSIRKRINNIIMEIPELYSLDYPIWPRPPK